MEPINNKNLKVKVISGLFWNFMQSIGTQGIQFIVSIILARILTPKDFGVIGLISVFIAVANVFVQSGFGSALVQKKEVDDTDRSSVFYLSLTISLLLYAVLFFSAPLIAAFYNDNFLIPILRLLSLSLIFGAFNTIQNAVLSREMKFKKSFMVNIGGVLASGSVGITMACLGYGVWSLVFSQLTGQFTSTIILFLSVRWRPQLLFSFKKLKGLFNYGSKLLYSSLLNTIFNNLYPLIIGKIFDQTILGYYNRGQSIPSLIVNNIDGSIQNVMFPALTKFQHDSKRMKELVRRSIVTSTFLVFPAMFGLAAVAKPLVLILLTGKWLLCVPFLQLSCISFAFWPMQTSNLQAINAIGRSDIFFKLEIIKKSLIVLVILITFHFGIYAMITGSTILSVSCTFINSWPNKKLLNYSYREQLHDIMPSLLLTLAMSAVVVSISFLNLSIWLSFPLQIVFGVAFYITGAYIFKFECFKYLLVNIKKAVSQRLSPKTTA